MANTDLNAFDKAQALELSAALNLAVPMPGLGELLTDKNRPAPVIITIAGLNFGEIGPGLLEIKHFVKLINIFFPNKGLTETDLASGVAAFNSGYFFLENNKPPQDAAAPINYLSLPDNYIAAKLQEVFGYSGHNVALIPFPWSRDPEDTQRTVPELEKKLIAVYDSYKATGRPIYIVAHSWGSILTHQALHNMERYRPDVRIDKFITTGSPLVPANFVLKLFMDFAIKREQLEKAVTKPSQVRAWYNIWAMRDAYSNAIPAADANYQADATVGNVESALINLILRDSPLKKEARRDLFKIRNIRDWHFAYFLDFKASLKSINKEIFVPICRQAIAPQILGSGR